MRPLKKGWHSPWSRNSSLLMMRVSNVSKWSFFLATIRSAVCVYSVQPSIMVYILSVAYLQEVGLRIITCALYMPISSCLQMKMMCEQRLMQAFLPLVCIQSPAKPLSLILMKSVLHLTETPSFFLMKPNKSSKKKVLKPLWTTKARRSIFPCLPAHSSPC